MSRLIDISTTEDILPEYRQTPIGLLLEYHNLNRPPDKYSNAQLLIGTCIDNRIQLHIPDNFSFIVRSGGANLKHSEFNISYAISGGGVQHIALIGHSNCKMADLVSGKKQFIKGLVDKAGWDEKTAEDHFTRFAPVFEIGNEINFVLSEVKRLRLMYPKVCIAPMLYKMNDHRLYLINEQ